MQIHFREKSKFSRFLTRSLVSLIVLLPLSLDAQDGGEYKILKPETSQHLVPSEHFVARWNDSDNVPLSEEEIRLGLETLEAIWKQYAENIGFPPPYANASKKFKISVNLSDKGWATGSGTGQSDPAFWLNYKAFQDHHALAHEFAHSLQFGTERLRDSLYTGWFWECHAEFMAHQTEPNLVGCSDQLVNAPHIYYGSTRDRYGCWLFWEYIKDCFGYSAVNEVWTKAKKQGAPDYKEETPLSVLARNMHWSDSDLNDQFGIFAMHNVTWDYPDGDVFRQAYGSYDDKDGTHRHRTSLLKPVPGSADTYVIPDYHAPQRLGYNLVRLKVNQGVSSITVQFHGLVQDHPGVSGFHNNPIYEPEVVPEPDSDWRWAIVTVGPDGKPGYSDLQRGASASVSCNVSGAKEVWLVVVATPKKYQKIVWDQMYYTIYRYPWMVHLEGATPDGLEPVAPAPGQTGAPHANGGGWVASTAHVDDTAFVGPDARVLGHAQVHGTARIEGHAVVDREGEVKDRAIIRDYAMVTGRGVVGEDAVVCDEATIRGGVVDGQATVGAMSLIDGNAHIHGKAILRMIVNYIDRYEVGGTAQLLGDIELQTPVFKGVFYGMVSLEMANDPKFGADRKEPVPEVTIYPLDLSQVKW